MAGTLTGSVTLTPSAVKQTLSDNYLGSADFDFMNQYLPDTYESEFVRYGTQSIGGFLRFTGSEMPLESDLIKWSEEGRLHTKYTACGLLASPGAGGVPTAGDDVVIVNAGSAHNVRLNETVVLSNNGDANSVYKGVVTAIAPNSNANHFSVALYNASGIAAGDVSDTFTVFVFGSEFRKGTNSMEGALASDPEIFENSPVIIKEHYEVAGSDMAQVTWIKVKTPEGSGYVWYLKNQHDTRRRFDNKIEMAMIEGVEAETNSGAAAAGLKGTKGLFKQIESEGNVWDGGNPTALADFDTMVNRLDAQGMIEENALFVNRSFDLDIDDMLATQNSYGANGTSFGLFDNDEQMALNLGFKGFKRGGYNFYKSSWKYLNDPTLRGGLVGGAVNGVMIPGGSTSVYDMVEGENIERPYIHVRYRAKDNENRKYKTWAHGGAGGQKSSGQDAINVEFLTERALCAVGANNYFIFQA